MTLGNTYVLNLSSVHQIGKDLKCCLVEDYHRRSMNLITVGGMAHVCKAPFKRLSDRGPRSAVKSGPHLPQLEKALAQKRRPNAAKTKIIN